LSSEPDRLYIRKKDKEIFDRILGNGSPLSRDLGFENKDIFFLALSLGYDAKNRRTLDKRLGYFLSKNLNDEDEAVMCALAVAEEGDLAVLFDRKKVFLIAEEYAAGGIRLLQDKVQSGMGSFSKRLESSLIQVGKGQKREFQQKESIKLMELIEKGENEKVEFKSSLCWDYKKEQKHKSVEHAVAKTISALMNSEGGFLLIGVKDNGEILGLEKDFSVVKKPNTDAFQQHFTNLLNKYIGKENGSWAKMGFKTIGGKVIAIVEVSKSPNEVYLKSEGTEEFYIRLGNSSHPLNVREANAYIKKHWG